MYLCHIPLLRLSPRYSGNDHKYILQDAHGHPHGNDIHGRDAHGRPNDNEIHGRDAHGRHRPSSHQDASPLPAPMSVRLQLY